uniref:C-type lectin domain-containing protein n=1 Tax=Takifugu rubripes TaxID=31033 RepID=A0A674P9R8_TAKRU
MWLFTALPSGDGKVKKSSSRCAVLFFCLLFLLLLLLFIGLLIRFETLSSICEYGHLNQPQNLEPNWLENLTKQRDQLQTGYNNVTKELDQLQSSYIRLVKEKDQIQTSYDNLVKEKDQIQTSYDNLVKEKDQIQTRSSTQSDKTPDAEEQFMHLRFVFLFPCPAGKGWVYFSGSLYQVSSTKKTWDQSRSDCRQKGADLLIINSEEEQVSQFTRAGPNIHQRKYMWIGLTDVTNEGSWKWVDGTSSFSPVTGVQRSRTAGKAKNCVDIKNFNAEKSWNDESCSLSLLWICEKKLFQ